MLLAVSSVFFLTRLQLDKTIDRIGMGSYQWTLLSLCGFGEFFSVFLVVVSSVTTFLRLDGRQCQYAFAQNSSFLTGCSDVDSSSGHHFTSCTASLCRCVLPSMLHRLLQLYFLVPDRYIGAVSSSLFCGMMFGAVGWGTCTWNPSLGILLSAYLHFQVPTLWVEAPRLTPHCFSLHFLGYWRPYPGRTRLCVSFSSCWAQLWA